MVLTGLRGVDDINSLLDNIKYTPSLINELVSLAEEVTMSHCFLGCIAMQASDAAYPWRGLYVCVCVCVCP